MRVQGYQAAACPRCGQRSMILSFAGVGEGSDWLHPAQWHYESAECMEGCAVPAGWVAYPAAAATRTDTA